MSLNCCYNLVVGVTEVPGLDWPCAGRRPGGAVQVPGRRREEGRMAAEGEGEWGEEEEARAGTPFKTSFVGPSSPFPAVPTHTHTHTHTRTHTQTRIHIQTWTHTHRKTHRHKHTDVNTHTDMNTHIHTHTHTRTHTHTHTAHWPLPASLLVCPCYVMIRSRGLLSLEISVLKILRKELLSGKRLTGVSPISHNPVLWGVVLLESM